MENEVEIWKDVVGFEEYFKVSNLGRILGKRSGKILKGSNTSSGYTVITTRFGSRSGPIGRFLVHRAVAEAFIPEPDNLQYLKTDTFYGIIPVNHKDGNKKNNVVSNLEWCSYSENTKHAFETGLQRNKLGIENPNFRLTLEQIKYVQENHIKYDQEFGARAIGRKFGVCHNCITAALLIDISELDNS